METKRKGQQPHQLGPVEKEGESLSTTYFMVEHSFATSEHVAPMFQVVWKYMATAFTANLINTDDPDVATICLEGIYNAIRVAARFRLEDERNALIENLAVLTKLDHPSEMEPKNAMCVQALTALAVTDGNFIGSSWVRMLRCISQLSRLLLMTSSGEDDSVLEPTVSSTNQVGKKRSQPSPPADLSLKATLVLKRVMDYTTVDRIFIRSVNLNEEAIVEFVDALTEVSRSELFLKSSSRKFEEDGPIKKKSSSSSSSSNQIAVSAPRPRLFSLQKIVEVADFNIESRPRMTWGKVWHTIGEHFVASGCHSSVQVAMYAVDSLRQLSDKFLNKEEFVGFAFQDRFLRPFEMIVKQAASAEVRALVLHCMQFFIAAKPKSIKSGWGAVFDVLAASCNDLILDNVLLAYNVLDLAHKKGAPAYLYANCSLKFASTRDRDLSIKCLSSVEEYAGSCYLDPATMPPHEGVDELIESVENPIKARELFQNLVFFACRDSREEIRTTAFQAVFTILRHALEDRASPVIISGLFSQDVLATVGLNAPSIIADTWSSCTLSYVITEIVRFLSLALYENDVERCSPDVFSKKRTLDDENLVFKQKTI